MNTTKPVAGFTSNQQGTQICNNTQTKGETDFVNYSATGTGGFAFQQQSSSVTTNTMATLYKTGTATTMNLPNAQSQFQVNGVNIGRDLTSTLVSTRVPTTISFTVGGSVYSSSIVTATNISTNTINGTSVVNVDWITTSSPFPITAPLEISATNQDGSLTQYVPIAQLNGPAPSNNLTTSINMNMYLGTGGSIGNQIKGYGAIVVDNSGSYWVIFASYTNIPINTPICFDPFQFSYQ